MGIAPSIRLLPSGPIHGVHPARRRADWRHRGRAHPHAARRHPAAHHCRRAHPTRLQVAHRVHRRAHHGRYAAGARRTHAAHLRRQARRGVVHGRHAVRHGIHGRHVAAVEARVAGGLRRVVRRLAGEHRRSAATDNAIGSSVTRSQGRSASTQQKARETATTNTR